ncbi:MAG: hypothetical protein WCF36_08370 [Candidatus Nanopelagicales bacterium]
MLVADLHHFLDLPDDVPGPFRRLAEQLGNIVWAATAGAAWETALPCARRPARRACPGRVIVLRAPQAPIRWQCSACGDEGVISNREDCPYDLRRRGLTVAPAASEIVIPNQVAAALRDLQLLDPDCERTVFRIRAHGDHIVLTATAVDLDELIGGVAAEANHETNRRRQQRLDTAFNALTSAADTLS